MPKIGCDYLVIKKFCKLVPNPIELFITNIYPISIKKNQMSLFYIGTRERAINERSLLVREPAE